MKCCYRKCKHPDSDDLSVKNSYHADCYKEMQDWKLFERIWRDRINRSTPIPILIKAENELIQKGYSTDYVLFGLDYCIEHKMNLRFPPGLKYFLEREEVKNAYSTSKNKEVKKIMNDYMKEIDDKPVDLHAEQPEKIINEVKPKGRRKFKSILGGA